MIRISLFYEFLSGKIVVLNVEFVVFRYLLRFGDKKLKIFLRVNKRIGKKFFLVFLYIGMMTLIFI